MKSVRLFAVIGAAVLLAGCATTPASGEKEPLRQEKAAGEAQTRDKSAASSADAASELPLSRTPVSTYLGGEDPIEGVNRSIFYCVDFFYYWLYRPVGYLYGSIVPRPAVNCINNFTDNLEFPRRFLGSLLQAKFTGSGIELLRFLANSTIGIGGLFDPAWYWFGLPRQEEDFGQAFAAWGIGPGCVLQLHYSTNIRDAVGMIFDYAVDIKSYFYGGQAFTFLNRGLNVFGLYENARMSTFDSYQALKDYQLLVRRIQLDDAFVYPESKVALQPDATDRDEEKSGRLPEYYSQGSAVDTLRSDWLRPEEDWWWVRLSFWNRNFARLADTGEVTPEPGGAPVQYRYRLRDNEPEAPLAVILPGVGGHNSATNALALAELCHRAGMAVVTVSNPMNYEMVEAFPEIPPGYGPDDVKKLRAVLKLVVAELRKKSVDIEQGERPFAPSRVAVLGYSQGGLNALLLAAQEEKSSERLFDRYVAVNPPVDLLKALASLDEAFRALDGRSREEALGIMLKGAGRYIYTVRTPAELVKDGGAVPREDDPEKTRTVDQVPVEEAVARVLIGYSFRRSLEDMIVCMHHRAPVPGIRTPYQWGNRQALYDELAAWNFRRYCEEVLVPYYSAKRGKTVTAAELNGEAGLRAIGQTLRSNPSIRVLHSADDFLLDQSDRDFLRETLGDRLTVFEHGGHLGNLYRDEVRQAIVKALREQR